MDSKDRAGVVVLTMTSSVLAMTTSALLPSMPQRKGLLRLFEASICHCCILQLHSVVTKVFVLLLVCFSHIAEIR